MAYPCNYYPLIHLTERKQADVANVPRFTDPYADGTIYSLNVQAAVTADAERLLAALMEPCERGGACQWDGWAFGLCRPCRLRAAWAVVEKEMNR